MGKKEGEREQRECINVGCWGERVLNTGICPVWTFLPVQNQRAYVTLDKSLALLFHVCDVGNPSARLCVFSG